MSAAEEVARISVASPLGPLTLTEQAGAVVTIDWHGTDPRQQRETALLREAIRQLADYFAGRRRDFDLPLHPAGSEHDQAVWRQMLAIPFGQTRTYGDLARAIGSNARAVGGACGANPIPIIIPCHRVMAAGGGFGGYSGKGGVETKTFLLRHEGAVLL